MVTPLIHACKALSFTPSHSCVDLYLVSEIGVGYSLDVDFKE
jgi:hypothetical protein